MAPALLVPEDATATSFAGYMRVDEDEFKLRVCGISYADGARARGGAVASARMVFTTARVEAEPWLASRLAPHAATIQVRLLQAVSLDGFLRELQELLSVGATPLNRPPQHQQQLRDPTAMPINVTALPRASYYSRLMDELTEIGWARVTALSEDLSTVELCTQDASARTHHVRVSLPNDYPRSAPTCVVDAPEPFTLHWSFDTRRQTSSHHSTTTSNNNNHSSNSMVPASPSLRLVLQQFERFLEGFQAFWDALEDVDASCCVLEPQHPPRSMGRRRVALQRHVSVQIEISPQHPRQVCELRFFGSETLVAPLRARWSDRLFQWEEACSVPVNLARLLDVALPSPTTTAPEEFAVECGICYCYRLELEEPGEQEDMSPMGTLKSVEMSTSEEEKETKDTRKSRQKKTMIPDRLCENDKCCRPFHGKCLLEWLQALPTARQSFNTVFGECPYCREAISAKLLA